MRDKEMCAREKYWSELDADGKVERMRRRVKSLQRQVEELQSIVRAMKEHSHTSQGIIVVPLHKRMQDESSCSRPGMAEQDYF